MKSTASSIWFCDRYREQNLASTTDIRITGMNLQGDEESKPVKAKEKTNNSLWRSLFGFESQGERISLITFTIQISSTKHGTVHNFVRTFEEIKTFNTFLICDSNLGSNRKELQLLEFNHPKLGDHHRNYGRNESSDDDLSKVLYIRDSVEAFLQDVISKVDCEMYIPLRTFLMVDELIPSHG